jgi:Tol biopolymer transport system component/DNA-binding winged helix-turn-helix (wHTH) protein
VLDSGPVDGPKVPENGEARTRRFGAFEIDLVAGELRRNGLKVKLQEQPLQVLGLLLERPGEVVSRDDLRNRLWPADTFVDFDHSLNAAIKRLRDGLGDSAENPRFVETVARRGYRFLAPVSIGPANGNRAVEERAASKESARRPKRRIPMGWIVAATAAIALVLFGLKLGLLLGRRPPAALRISQLTANPADDRVRAGAISSDGKYLAYSDENGFYLRQIDTAETHPVPLPPGLMAESLSWFPDSVHIVAALSGQGQPSSLWAISVLGGNARKFYDSGASPAVSPDGKEVAFITGRKLREQVWVVGTDGTGPRKLVGEKGDFFGALAWSPDGAMIAYTRGRIANGYGVKGAIEILQAQEQRVIKRLPVAFLNGPLAWVRDGRLIYSLNEPRPHQLDSNLWSVALDERAQPTDAPARLTNDSGEVLSISAAADGRRVLYLKGMPEPDVYVGKLEGQRRLSEPSRLTLDDRQDIPYDWTPDGKEVIFVSDRTGTFSIYRQAIDQALPELLVAGSEPILEPRLSPDGTQLLYVQYPNWGERVASVPLMRVPLAGGTPQKVVEANWISNHQCARAPAKVCLYSVAGENELTFFTFDVFKGKGAQLFQIKDDFPQLYNWSLSPDGKMLAIAKGKWGDESPRIHLVPLNGGADKWLEIRDWPGVASLDWAADSRSLWAASIGEGENALLNIDLRGHVDPVWRPRKNIVGWAIPSRDGRYLALHVGSSSANAWMVEQP